MKKAIILSLVCTLSLYSAQVELEDIEVETSLSAELIRDVSGEEIKSADLGEALFKQSPAISLVRRSGVANDIRVRGQKKDNISVSIDGTKVHGACPNRMDPPISHVLTNNVDFIEINEGPFNVEDFGVLSADIKVHTLKPKKAFEGELNLGLGSFDYKKGAFSLSGGTDTMRFFLSGSMESSGQYEDANGNNFAGQIQDKIDKNQVPATTQYIDKKRDAYEKKTLMAKMFWNITDNQELRVSYTANRSDNILYPTSKMDALYDDSDIYNIEYIAKDLGKYSKKLYLQAYQSEVEHPMSTKYRLMGETSYMTHALTTKMQGLKLKNTMEFGTHTLTMGLDYGLRNWDGHYTMNDIALNIASNGTKPFNSIHNVDTQNTALFLSDSIKMGKLVVDMGLRYDMTQITSGNSTQQDNDYDGINGYLLGTYHATNDTKYFLGLGKSSRVPDAKELYWIGSMGNPIGTENLNETVNYEVDMGVETQFDNASLKAKVFYSKLQDYIAYNASNGNTNNYENVDATLYGFELSGTYIATDSLYFDYGMAYQKGTKDNPLKGQSDTSLPDISPFKTTLALNYDWDSSLNMRAEVIASSAWDDYDADNGEQKLDAYAVLNLKASKSFGKNFIFTLGVDNVLDETYSVSNTYKDLILLPTIGESDVMLMNEVGRYFYTNIKYKF